jgi:hypothetical protein
MVESPPSSTPDGAPPGLSIEAVEWLPSGADSGLVRVRGHWAVPDQAPAAGLPALIVRSGGAEQRFESLPDARSLREPGSWRGSYLVPAALMAASLEGLTVEWPGAVRAVLPLPARGAEPLPAPAVESAEAGGEVIDRAVLAERRAARAEAAEQAQARAAAEALRAVEALELRSAELERRVAEAGGSSEEVAALESRLAGERAVHAEVREELQRRLEAEQEARAAAEAAVVAAREERSAALESAESAAAGAREAADAIAARVVELESALAAAEAATAAESAARAALEDELDRSRFAAADLAAMLAAERAARSGIESAAAANAAELEAARAELESARAAHAAELESARAAHAGELESARAHHAAELQSTRSSLATELEAVREAIATELAAEQEARGAVTAELETLRAELDASRAALTQILADLSAERAAREADREAIAQLRAELDARAVPEIPSVPLEEAAREQVEAAATAARRPDEESGRLIADLEAAASALREAAPAEPAPPEPVAEAAVSPPVAEPTVSPPIAEPAAPPPPAIERPRPKIVSARSHPPREHAVGRSARQYPPLRGALVKLAHDDPKAAGQLIAGLLPAHGVALAETLDYDLTIREVGTYSISIAGKRAFVKPQQEPRSRKEAQFHLTADALTLAELLAGVDRRVGRFFGAARFKGSRSRLRALKHLPDTALSLREAARAGARLDPGPVWKAFAYVVHPSWTREDRWTVAQEILGDQPETWYLTSGNGNGFKVAATLPPDKRPDTTVSMTRETFDLLLRGDQPPKGKLPTIRGDRRAAAQIKAWADRAQGLADG